MTPSQQRNLTHRATAKEDGGQHQEEWGSTRLPWSLGLLIWRLQTTELYALTLQAKSLKSGRWQRKFLLGDSGETLGHTTVGFRWQPVILAVPCAMIDQKIHPIGLCSGFFFNNFIFRIYFISAPGSGVTSLSWDRKRTFVRTKETWIHSLGNSVSILIQLPEVTHRPAGMDS